LNKHELNIIEYKGYLTNDINKTILPQKLLTKALKLTVEASALIGYG